MRGHYWRCLGKLSPGARLHYSLITSYYPTAALGWILGAVNCVIYLVLGAKGLQIEPHVWIAVYADLAAVQFCLYAANRKHNVSPHEMPGSSGAAGMGMSVLAAPVYVVAMVQTLLHRRGGFVVTPKGAMSSRDRLRTFRLHFAWGVLLLGALAESMWVDRPQTSMRLWSLTLIVVCLTPFAVSTFERARSRRVIKEVAEPGPVAELGPVLAPQVATTRTGDEPAHRPRSCPPRTRSTYDYELRGRMSRKVQRRRRQRGMQVVVGLLVVIGLLAVNGPPLAAFVRKRYRDWKINTASYKRRYGHWSMLSVPTDMRVNAVHAILLNTGKVLIMAGSGNSVGNFDAGKFESIVWNPANDSFKKIKTPYDMFCGGHVILPDGKVLIAGGTARYEVLASAIKYAAGVMTVINSATRVLKLAAGTAFKSPSGQMYRSTAATTILPARRTPVAGTRRTVITPSYTPLWVKAVVKGNGPVSQTQQSYMLEGIPVGAAATLQATAFSITRDQQNFWGSDKSYIFDPASERYEQVSDMNLARWYPTLVGLADGKVLAVSGLDQFGRMIQGNSEVFDPKTDRWTLEPKLSKPFPTYPALFLMPNGDLFFTGSNAGYGPVTPEWRTPGIWNPVTNAFQPVSGMRDPKLTETSGSVLLPPAQDQRYAIVGGGGVGESALSTGRIDVVDLSSRDPRWQAASSLPVGTRYPELVITPNDGVVISGGSSDYRGKHASDIFECHLFDPQTGKLTRLADPLVGRDYHSEGLLLPDGRILTLGGNPLFGNKADTTPGFFEQRIAIFSPPYLYHGPRPRLTGGPSELDRGQTGVFQTPNAGEIVKARLMHPSAVTHVTDVQQRSIALGLKREDGAVALTVPRGDGLVPSGWYMVMVDNNAGVPSVARWVHID